MGLISHGQYTFVGFGTITKEELTCFFFFFFLACSGMLLLLLKVEIGCRDVLWALVITLEKRRSKNSKMSEK